MGKLTLPESGIVYTEANSILYARYHKLRGFDLWFLTGTDENATKVREAAAKAGKPAMEYVDGLTEASQRRGRNSRKIHKLGFSKFAEPDAYGLKNLRQMSGRPGDA